MREMEKIIKFGITFDQKNIIKNKNKWIKTKHYEY